MKKAKKEYLIWIKRAQDDLLWTMTSIKGKIYYGACFSSQQAVEKALKAYLLFIQNKFDKIHDLVKLLDECVTFDSSFRTYRRKVASLTFYYIQTRYPDISDLDKFTLADAEEALSIASEIVSFITKKIEV